MGNRQSSVTSTVENEVKNSFEQSCDMSSTSVQSIDGLNFYCSNIDNLQVANNFESATNCDFTSTAEALMQAYNTASNENKTSMNDIFEFSAKNDKVNSITKNIAQQSLEQKCKTDTNAKQLIKDIGIQGNNCKNISLTNNQNLQATCILTALNKVDQLSKGETKNDRTSNLVNKADKKGKGSKSNMTNLMMMIGGCVVLMAIIGLAVYFIKKQGNGDGKSMANLALLA